MEQRNYYKTSKHQLKSGNVVVLNTVVAMYAEKRGMKERYHSITVTCLKPKYEYSEEWVLGDFSTETGISDAIDSVMTTALNELDAYFVDESGDLLGEKWLLSTGGFNIDGYMNGIRVDSSKGEVIPKDEAEQAQK